VAGFIAGLEISCFAFSVPFRKSQKAGLLVARKAVCVPWRYMYRFVSLSY
jgi:hypothetical protein